MKELIEAKFSIGNVIKHKFLDFRGVIFDLDPEFNNTEEWYQAIPETMRPSKDQPFYHVLAENKEIFYIAYVSEQNLLLENLNKPANHPDISTILKMAITCRPLELKIKFLYQNALAELRQQIPL